MEFRLFAVAEEVIAVEALPYGLVVSKLSSRVWRLLSSQKEAQFVVERTSVIRLSYFSQ